MKVLHYLSFGFQNLDHKRVAGWEGDLARHPPHLPRPRVLQGSGGRGTGSALPNLQGILRLWLRGRILPGTELPHRSPSAPDAGGAVLRGPCQSHAQVPDKEAYDQEFFCLMLFFFCSFSHLDTVSVTCSKRTLNSSSSGSISLIGWSRSISPTSGNTS